MRCRPARGPDPSDLAEKYGPQYIGKTPEERAEVMQWLCCASTMRSSADVLSPAVRRRVRIRSEDSRLRLVDLRRVRRTGSSVRARRFVAVADC